MEFCSLVNVMVFFFNYAVENKERLPQFKVIWRILSGLYGVLPTNKLKNDCVSIVMPVLQRIQTFCQTSSPSLEMLQFLKIVLSDIKSLMLTKAHKSSLAQFFTFLDGFLFDFTKVIPHNLHDEVFQVCQLICDLLGTQSCIRQEHVRHIMEALLHKYTMRSKAHKTLCQDFIKTWVLDQSALVLAKSEKQEGDAFLQQSENEFAELATNR